MARDVVPEIKPEQRTIERPPNGCERTQPGKKMKLYIYIFRKHDIVFPVRSTI